MAKGRFSNDLPQSGLPGLRFRRDTQMWVVSLPVPTSLRATLKNRQGKPLTRLERSTGERDEARARRAYPKFLAELEAELHQRTRAAGIDTTTQDEVERAIGKIYRDIVDNKEAVSRIAATARQLKPKTTGIKDSGQNWKLMIGRENESTSTQSEANEQIKNLLASTLFKKHGLHLDDDELGLAQKSLRWALLEAGKYGEEWEKLAI